MNPNRRSTRRELVAPPRRATPPPTDRGPWVMWVSVALLLSMVAVLVAGYIFSRSTAEPSDAAPVTATSQMWEVDLTSGLTEARLTQLGFEVMPLGEEGHQAEHDDKAHTQHEQHAVVKGGAEVERRLRSLGYSVRPYAGGT